MNVSVGSSLFVAFIDSESVVIAILWLLLTPAVGINSLGHLYFNYKPAQAQLHAGSRISNNAVNAGGGT
jgi:hypothetical protein